MSNSEKTTLASIKFEIDLLYGGGGVTIGAPATKKGFNVYYNSIFEKIVTLKNSIVPFDNNSNIGGANVPFNNGYFNDLFINGKIHLEQKQLWTSTWFMNASQTAYLSEPISEQQHGILLFFQAYENGNAQDYWHNVYFVPKSIVKLKPGVGHSFHMVGGSDYGGEGRKYLYIYDDKIVGNQHNEGSGSKNGITYANNKFVLKYVYGISKIADQEELLRWIDCELDNALIELKNVINANN